MRHDPLLRAFWITVPEGYGLGIGVTGYSEQDALALAWEAGALDQSVTSDEVQIQGDISLADLEQNHVVPNMTPMQFRGVWYPMATLGKGRPR